MEVPVQEREFVSISEDTLGEIALRMAEGTVGVFGGDFEM